MYITAISSLLSSILVYSVLKIKSHNVGLLNDFEKNLQLIEECEREYPYEYYKKFNKILKNEKIVNFVEKIYPWKLYEIDKFSDPEKTLLNYLFENKIFFKYKETNFYYLSLNLFLL